MRALLLRAIRLYQGFISPSLGIACRYEPTCSHYAYEAIERHGAWRGVRVAAGRLGRCRPGGGNGYDPVPPSSEDSVSRTSTSTSTQNPTVTAADLQSRASDASLR